MLKIKHLSKKIQNKTILKEFNFEIASGKAAIFLGESGAGKSTLLRVLNNLEEFDEGLFFLDGSPLHLKNANRSHTIGMVFQHFNLFEHLNVEENITYALIHCQLMNREEAKIIAKKLLIRYGLQEKSKSSVNRLSGGQKQRLAIARTLALNPKIICLDEPTSALDPRLSLQVAQFIKQLTEENRIILLTTHDMNLLKQVDGQLFFIEEGTIVESGAKNECLLNQLLYPKIHRFLNGI